jgi:hypothetical protein
MKQTAVECLIGDLIKKGLLTLSGDTLKSIGNAKEMEEKIIAQAFEDGDYNYFYSKKTGKEFENGIEYYNEKFKQQ